MVKLFTHVHKITNVPVLYIENTHNDFDVDHSFPCFYSKTSSSHTTKQCEDEGGMREKNFYLCP
jgi:hypothetical protein